MSYACSQVKSESEIAKKNSYGAVREMLTLATLCRFQCDVAEVYVVPSAVALVVCLSS